MSKFDYLQTSFFFFALAGGEMIKSSQNPQSATLLEKDSIVDLPI